MSAATALQAMRVPGALAVGPTNLSTAFPHGGTALGLVRAVIVRRRELRFDVTAEEYGGAIVDTLYRGEEWSLVFELRGWDNDAISALFPNTTLPTVSGERTIQFPQTTKIGGVLQGASAVKLIFTPEDQARHRAVYFRSAIPLLAEEVDMRHARAEEMTVAAGFRALRDGVTANSSVQVALVEDLTL